MLSSSTPNTPIHTAPTLTAGTRSSRVPVSSSPRSATHAASPAPLEDPFEAALRALDRAGVVYEILPDAEHLGHAA